MLSKHDYEMLRWMRQRDERLGIVRRLDFTGLKQTLEFYRGLDDKLPVKERQLYFSNIRTSVVLLVIMLGVFIALQQFQAGILSLPSPVMGDIGALLLFGVFVSGINIWDNWIKCGIVSEAYREGYNRALNDLYTKQAVRD